MKQTNYYFLKSLYPQLYIMGNRAEAFVFEDPRLAMSNYMQMGESMLETISRLKQLAVGESFFQQIITLELHGAITEEDAIIFRFLQQMDPHDNTLDTAAAFNLAGNMYDITCRFYQKHVAPDFAVKPYLVPQPLHRSTELAADFDANTETGTITSVQVEFEGALLPGEWSEGIVNLKNYAAVQFTDGDRYEGRWERGMKHGQGKYIWRDGTRYSGHWKSDLENGIGEKQFANGDVYTGNWKDGMFHGQGSYLWKDGTKFTGEWQESQEHGKGNKTFPNGSTQEGCWSYGEFVYISDQLEQKGTVSLPSWPRTFDAN